MRVDTECISDFVLQNTHLHSFFKKLPILEKYYEFIDKRVAKCKEAWMKFFRPYKANMGELADKIKAREERLSGAHNSGYNSMVDESSNPLCTDLFALLRQSKMTEELLNFITDDLHDTEILARLNVHCQEHMQTIIEEIRERIEPAVKQTLAILSELRAKLKAVICIHGEDSPYTLGFQLNHINSLFDHMSNELYLCDAMVVQLSNAKREIKNMLVFFNSQVLKIYY